jgi:enterochelin esterase-like enzyme
VYLPSAYFQRAYANRDFPAIELLQGYPASPKSWTGPMDLQHIADSEIAAGRAEPFVAVIPTQNYVPHRDSECINAVGGSQVDTTLTVNVRRTIDSDFRVSPDRRSWAVAGYSTGGFCAVNMAVRHADMFTAAASLSGYDQPYIDRTTGQLFRDSRTARDDNNPLWRLEHLPPPDISLLLAASLQDHVPSRDARQLAAATRPPTRTDLLMLPRGGHNFGIWKAMEPVMIDWLARIIMPPLAPGMLAEGAHPVPGTSPISVETAPAAIVRAAGHKGDARGKRALGGG